MPVTTRVNAPEVQRLIADANRGIQDIIEEPQITDPPDTVFQLAAGYMQDDGKWVKDFEVRELTGRDEEALSRVNDLGRSLAAMMERTLVRVGNDAGGPSRLDSLIAGDWDTVLIALRTVTFGPEIELRPTCTECKAKYDVTVNLTTDLAIRSVNPEDLAWTVKGRKHTYELSAYTGATQRRIFEMLAEDATVPTINTEVLHDSITQIDGMPVLGRDEIRDLSVADRRKILDTIEAHRVGPDLAGVRIKCPTCGNEQRYPLDVAALFRWH